MRPASIFLIIQLSNSRVRDYYRRKTDRGTGTYPDRGEDPVGYMFRSLFVIYTTYSSRLTT